MDFIEFISFVYSTELPEDDFQAQVKYPKASYYDKPDLRSNKMDSLNNELIRFYYDWIYSDFVDTHLKIIFIDSFLRINFLEYHLHKYDGKSIDFLDFVNRSLKYSTDYYWKGNAYDEDKMDIDGSIRNWIEEKREHLSKEDKHLTTENQLTEKISKPMTTFKTNLTPEELDRLYNSLKGNLIANNTDSKLFMDVFSGVPVESLSGKISWIESVPLFVALFLGFGNKKTHDEHTYQFKGIITPSGNYLKQITYCFEFKKQHVTNESLSSTINKVYNQYSIRNIAKILPITEMFR